ncbi:MAG: hypothetical protein WCY11_15950 [Novosphingobium sp.]
MSVACGVASRVARPAAFPVTGRRRGDGWHPSSLFEGVVGGFWFDFTDAVALRQTSVGVPPVATASDPVGLAFDQSRWAGKTYSQVLADQPEVYPGGELAGNYNASGNSTTPEFFYPRSTWVPAVTGNTLTIPDAGGLTTNKIASNRAYRWRVSWTELSAGAIELRGNDNTLLASSSAASGTLEVIASFSMGSANTRPYIRFSAAASVTITEISFREVPGHHASQPSASLRPTYQLTHVRGDGSDDRLITSQNPTLAGTLIYAGTFEAASDVAIGVTGASGVDRCMLRTSADGYLQAAIGDQASAIIGAMDIRGVDGVYAVRWGGNGEAVKLTRGLTVEYAGVQEGSVTTAFPFLVGAVNAGGSATGFLDGKMRHCLFVPRFITDDELSQAVKYFS